ncbi:hypothetical protein EDD70_2964 [Hydrogenoanaerobacterium saccharovorans]|uniref:Uncharacterized protein n=1 Tax=Hydrogenoanaerobacterium saccharovorans TaxID=474960 RepID=A0A1H7YHV9_9FIRM|nr:hypothetical protein [Hydrogenoanaerobacterium saccharovorans]RPF41904.1 hypothetical protein EDD70_2964 [Hydrogenoanaerobacterium saccharovorans]SEM45533.1 hypothetical protein SAMN05216180_0047 [Hydrogenoanaerobacterium saccharovorans]
MIDYLGQKASLDSAIAAIESGAQEYRIGSRTVRRADLSTLYAERIRLEQKIEAQGYSGITVARLMRR